jgi:Protein of unknown function (DUF4240)
MRKIKLVSKIVKISLGRDFHLWGVIASEVGRHVLVYWCALPKNVQECNVPSLIHQNRVCYVSVTNNSKVISGKWKVIGTLSEAETGSWPVPCFSATETTSQPEYPGGRYWIVMPVYPGSLDGDRREARVCSESDAMQFPQNGRDLDPTDHLRDAVRDGWKGRRPLGKQRPVPLLLEPWDSVQRQLKLGEYHVDIELREIEALQAKSPQAPSSSRKDRVTKPRPIDSTHSPADVDQIWTLIDSIRSASAGDFLNRFSKRLLELKKSELRTHVSQFNKLLKSSNRWTLWGAAYLMNGGCSDDGFLYWRCWLIAQGRKVYEAALQDADSLSDAKLRFGRSDEFELEEILDAFDDAQDAVHLESDVLSDSSSDPRGKRWDIEDEDQARWRLPKLWNKYSEDSRRSPG